MTTKRRSPFAAFTAAISSLMSKVRSSPAQTTTGLGTAPPKDAYVNRPMLEKRKTLRPRWMAHPDTVAKVARGRVGGNQRQIRKDRRRAFAAGNRKAFA